MSNVFSIGLGWGPKAKKSDLFFLPDQPQNMASFGATQSDASRVFGRLKTSTTMYEPTSDETTKWYAMATALESVAKLIPVEKEANLTILANIGCQYAELQKSVAATIEQTSQVNVHALLTELETALSSGGGRGPYMLGDGSLISTVDLTLICALRKLVSMLYTVRTYPNVGQWFSACCSMEAFVLEIGQQRALGTKRIGCQIDRRPDPVESFAAATQSIRLNKGQKKKVTQRQLEKADKKKSNQQKKKGGESKESAEQVQQVNNIVKEFPATHEKAHENLLAYVKATGTIQVETKQNSNEEEEVSSWAKSLFLKDKKKKGLFMFTTPANASSVSLSDLTKALGRCCFAGMVVYG